MKTCTKCKIKKPEIEFFKDSSKKDKLSSSCKACKNAQNKEYQSKNKEAKAEYDRIRREAKRDEINAKKREYYHTKGKAVEKIWRAANWDKVLTYARNSKAKRRAIERSYDLPAGDLITWVDSQPKVCTYCKCLCEDSYHIDHIVPLSKGGAHSLDNLTIACPFCNISKGNKTLNEWSSPKQELIEAEDKKP